MFLCFAAPGVFGFATLCCAGPPHTGLLLKHDTLGAGNCFSIQIFHDKSWASYRGPQGNGFKAFPCLSGRPSDTHFGGTIVQGVNTSPVAEGPCQATQSHHLHSAAEPMKAKPFAGCFVPEEVSRPAKACTCTDCESPFFLSVLGVLRGALRCFWLWFIDGSNLAREPGRSWRDQHSRLLY